MKIINRMPNWQEMRTYINETLLPIAFEEQAMCAKGRLNTWLIAEPNYKTKTYKAAVRNQRIEAYCKKVAPQSEVYQVFWGLAHFWCSEKISDRKNEIFNIKNVYWVSNL